MQAARGTSVGASTRRRLLFVVVAVVAYTADQISKALAVAHLGQGPDTPLIGDLLQLHLTFNSGAAFSTGEGLTPLISVVAILATLTVLWFARRIGTTAWAVAMGLLLAGITGNLTDRVVRDPGPLRGHVVDFLQLPHWPVFNVADICINVAAGLIVVQAARGVRLDGTRADAPAAATDTTTDTATDTATGTGTRTDAVPENRLQERSE